ncbi:MAG: hypothetical protein ABJC26_16365 [Gemmatimonadaceae bacterium]
MSSFTNSPRLIRGGIVLVDPDSGQVKRVITLQYNPDTLTRSLQPQTVSDDGHDRSQALRLKGPPVETIKLDADINAIDQLETADSTATELGISPQLAALETLLYPASGQLIANNSLQAGGTLEILPLQAPLSLFVWSKQRVVPVRITDCSVTEEAFDTQLNPLRAKVSLSMRVLSIDDLGFSSKGGSLYMIYQQNKERLAQRVTGATLSALGLSSIP